VSLSLQTLESLDCQDPSQEATVIIHKPEYLPNFHEIYDQRSASGSVKKCQKKKISKKEKASQPKPFSCEFCRRKFAKVQALGGHTSGAHPKMSSKYASKENTRKSRAHKRMILEANQP
jgi:hypothetical protein